MHVLAFIMRYFNLTHTLYSYAISNVHTRRHSSFNNTIASYVYSYCTAAASALHSSGVASHRIAACSR